MKKFIALVLALLTIFSMSTLAFAEDVTEAPAENETTESIEDALGDYAWLLDLPFWTVGPAFKLAKIALKLVKVYLKIASIFDAVDTDAIYGVLEDLVNSNANQGEAETTAAAVLA